MRPLIWTELAALGLISALLASVAVAQEASPSANAPPPPKASTSGNTWQGIPVAVDPPPAPPSEVLTGIQWLERPSAEDFARLYPAAARDQSVSGRAVLDCFIDSRGGVGCRVISETPEGYGFGDATLLLSRAFRAAPQTNDGRPTQGGRVRIPITWRIA